MRKLTELDKRAMIAAYVEGESVASIARRLKVSRPWASKIVNEFRRLRAKAEGVDTVNDAANYKARLKRKSIAGIENGLDDSSDRYKQGNLGVQVMKGIGEFQGDSPANTVNVFLANINQLPPNWREEYRHGEDVDN